MAALPLDRVYLGYWVDHTYGAVLGSTLTVKSQVANVIVALLSIIIAFAGSHLWDLIAFVTFQARTTEGPRDGVYHQQQATLRNAASAGAATMDLTKMWWYWKASANHLPVRLLPSITLSFLCSGGFLAAGILSSLVVTSTSINVLANSRSCGYIPGFQALGVTEDQALDISKWFLEQISQDGQHARTCYNRTDTIPGCALYYKNEIPFNTTYVDPPFSMNASSSTQRAIQLETMPLNSQSDFGLNTKPSDRLTVQQRTICVPLDVSRQTREVNATNATALNYRQGPPFPGEKLVEWFLTQNVSTAEPEVTDSLLDTVWNVSSRITTRTYKTPPYLPIDSLLVEDSDTTLISISTGARKRYDSPVDDPVFSAHTVVVRQASDKNPYYESFTADTPASWIGCIEQFQICTAANKNCTTLTKLRRAFEQASELGLNAIQQAILHHFAYVLLDLGSSISCIGYYHPLLADENMALLVLPSNQWELEIQFAYAVVLASIQGQLTSIATGPGTVAPGYDSLPTLPLTPELEILCHSQMMKAPTGVSNINVFGLSFMVGLCGFTILLNLSCTNVLKFLSRRNVFRFRGMVAWEQDGLLQVQRKAFEGQGIGAWFGDQQSVPVRTSRTGFSDLTGSVDSAARRQMSTSTSTTIAASPQSHQTELVSVQPKSHNTTRGIRTQGAIQPTQPSGTSTSLSHQACHTAQEIHSRPGSDTPAQDVTNGGESVVNPNAGATNHVSSTSITATSDAVVNVRSSSDNTETRVQQTV